MSSSREKKGIIFLFAILVILIATVIFLAISLRVDPVAENLSNDQVIKTLLVISDEEKNVLSTDVIVYYPKTLKGALFNIPGNTGAIYESLDRVDRIDVVYKELGVDAYRKEISKLIEQTIPFSIELTINDLGKVTDLLGGLKVFVSSPVDSVGEDGQRYLLPSGAVVLDGDKIQTFMQYILKDESESERQDRRQNVVISLLSAIREKKNVIFNKNFLREFCNSFKVNIDDDAFNTLLSHLSNLDAEQLTPQTVTGTLRSVDGQMLLFPFYNGQLVKDIVKQRISMLLSDNTEVQTRVYVLEVQNGTSVQGRARNTAILLMNAGYDILQSINADRDDYEHTVIINHIGNKEAAETLGNFIGCYNIVEEDVKSEYEDADSAAHVDFTLILGRDFDGRRVVGGYRPESSTESND